MDKRTDGSKYAEKVYSWCPCMGAKCRGNNPPFCSIKTSNCKSVQTERLKQALQKAEAVIIGCGCGIIHFCRIYLFRGTF